MRSLYLPSHQWVLILSGLPILHQLLTELVVITVCLSYFITLKLILKPFVLSHPLFLSTYLQEGGRSWQEYYQGIDGVFPQ